MKLRNAEGVLLRNGYVLAGESNDRPVYKHPNGTEVVIFKKGFGFDVVLPGGKIKHARTIPQLDRFSSPDT